MFSLRALIFRTFKQTLIQVRCLYGVHHNQKRGVFYVKLEDNAKAVLMYRRNENVLDMHAVHVPHERTGEGLARLLAEAAFTYVIVNNYYMFLSCPYLQKYYLATKTPELMERVVGPKDILDDQTSEPLDTNKDKLPEPEDVIEAPPRGEI